jgi:hypothetical protein
MNADSTTRGGGRTAIWVALMIAGAAGLLFNAFLREGGMARKFVEVERFERVEARVAANEKTDGKSDGETDGMTEPAGDAGEATASADGTTLWVAPDDPRLASGELERMSTDAPIAWEVRTPVTAKEALAHADAVAAGEPGTAPRDIRPSPLDSLGVWVAAFLTLAIFSFLYRDNPAYKVAESVLVGVSAAYWMVNGFWSTVVPNLFAKLAPDLVRAYAMPGLEAPKDPTAEMALAFVPLALGFMLLMRLAPKGGWISVWPLAFIIGTTAGLKLVASIEADLIAQAAATMKPLVAFEAGDGGGAARAFDFWSTVGGVVGVVGVLSVLSYFFFSVEHRGAIGKSARLGIWFLMVTFGSAFGLTVMGRITLLAQRLEFLFNDWLSLG